MVAKPSLFLCHSNDLETLSSKGFTVTIQRKKVDIFLVRKDDKFYAYKNICPHTQAPLDWKPDEFLDSTGQSIICALHGATFKIESGACLSGPCGGVGLTPLQIEIVEGKIFLKLNS